jgi:Flp pilus assembly pilin Flp
MPSSAMRDQRGASKIEYIIAAAALTVVCLAGVRAFGQRLAGSADGQAACVASLDGAECEGEGADREAGPRPVADAPPIAKSSLGQTVGAVTAAPPPADTGPVVVARDLLPPSDGGGGDGKPRPDVVQKLCEQLMNETVEPADLKAGLDSGKYTHEEFQQALECMYRAGRKEAAKNADRMRDERAEEARKQHEKEQEEIRAAHHAEQMEIAKASWAELFAQQELQRLNDELAWELSKAAVDVAGTVDPTPISDAVSGAMSLGDGDVVGAGLSLVSMVPYAGDALGKTAKGAKLAKKIAALKDAVLAATKRMEKAKELTASLMKKAKRGGGDPPPVPPKAPGGGGPPSVPPKSPGGGDPPAGPPKGGGGDDVPGPPKKDGDGAGPDPGADPPKPPKRETPKRPRADKDELTDIGRNKPSPLTDVEKKQIGVWQERRNHYLDKWHGKDLDGVDDASKKLVQNTSADNAIRDHITPDDVAGKVKEQRGVEIRVGGKLKDHVGEVASARDSVKKNIIAIQGRLKTLEAGGDRASKSHQVLVEKLKDLQHVLDMSK